MGRDRGGGGRFGVIREEWGGVEEKRGLGGN